VGDRSFPVASSTPPGASPASDRVETGLRRPCLLWVRHTRSYTLTMARQSRSSDVRAAGGLNPAVDGTLGVTAPTSIDGLADHEPCIPTLPTPDLGSVFVT
jgi:hypothetical protein